MYDLKLTTSHVPAQSDMETREITIGALLREVAAARPEAEALVEIRQDGSEGRRWTYAGLLADAERLAMALSTRFAPGERVVIWSPNSPEWVLMECACALSGLALVTANPAFQARELAYVLEQSGAVGLFMVVTVRRPAVGSAKRSETRAPGCSEPCRSTTCTSTTLAGKTTSSGASVSGKT